MTGIMYISYNVGWHIEHHWMKQLEVKQNIARFKQQIKTLNQKMD